MITTMASMHVSTTAQDRTVTILAWMVFLIPAVGGSNELMAQDTLKSALAAFGILLAGLVLFWNRRGPQPPLAWHSMLALPLVLMLYALGSTVWSHAYLASVEAIRWLLLALLAWLGLNTLTRKNHPTLLWGIHAGVTVASVWAALQFWFDLGLFAQGPAPASTFYNRNFFAEYAVCALPFSVWLLTHLRQSRWLVWFSLTLALNITAILMTGTRSALIALLVMLPVLAMISLRYRRALHWGQWSRTTIATVLLAGLGASAVLGNLPTTNPRIAQELTGVSAWQRGAVRTASMAQTTEYTVGSFSVRSQMWRATLRMMVSQPLVGVGAGAWEVNIPLFQNDDTTLEIDYYAHNEYLQLLSEYGLVVGGLVLAFLGAYWLLSVLITRRLDRTHDCEGALRAFTLTSMFAMGVVSAAGFPWHLAGCGVLFALGLAILWGSDLRLVSHLTKQLHAEPWSRAIRPAALLLLLLALGLATYVTQRAVRTERAIVQALLWANSLPKTQISLTPTQQDTKDHMLALLRGGIALNPHYRKLTPMASEVLMAQGDWANAAWILQSVTDSRPHVAALWKGQALAHAQMHHVDLALQALHQVQRLRSDTKPTQNLEIVVLSNIGQEAKAADLLRGYFDNRNYDYELVQAGYALGLKMHDQALAIRALEVRNQTWPEQAADGYFRMGTIYAEATPPNSALALRAFASGLATVPATEKDNFLQQVPAHYRTQLRK
ncbi:MAG: hypothetical protein RL302_236 [Pseudomonadota bacterium]